MISSTEQLVPDKSTTPARHLRHIRELDGVRGLAALMVFFHHLCYTSFDTTGWSAPVRMLSAAFRYGESGVDIFFVLSGFLITALLIEAKRSESYYQDFYWKRVLRILPLYILCLIGVLLFIPGSKSYVLLCVLFVSNFAWLFHITTDGPFWTLAIEEQFYLLWPTVVRRRSVQQLRRWALCIGVTSIALRVVAAGFGHYDYRFTFFRCDALAFGALLACWHSERDPAQSNSARENWAIALCFVAGAVLFALSCIDTPQIRLFALGQASFRTGVTFISGSIIAYLISHTGQRHLAWLRSPAVTFFGLISYALYLLNSYVILLYDKFSAPIHVGNYTGYIVRVLSVFSITIVVCVLSRYLIERPAISLRKYVLAKPRS